MLLTQKLEQMSNCSRDAQATISEYILKHKDTITRYSMQYIADETFSSKATLVRVAKKLGFSGWNDFMAAFQQEVRYLVSHKSDVNVNKPFSQKSSPMEIAGNIAAVRRESVQQTIEMLDNEELNKAVDALEKAKRILVFGVSVNRYMGAIYQHLMLQIGRVVEIVDKEEHQLMIETMQKDDCAIVISYSGNDIVRDPVKLMPLLKKKGVPMIGLTSMGDNLLRQYADYTLTIASQEKLQSKVGSFATISSTMFLLDVLFGCYFARHFDENYAYKTVVTKTIETRRYSTTEGVMEE